MLVQCWTVGWGKGVVSRRKGGGTSWRRVKESGSLRWKSSARARHLSWIGGSISELPASVIRVLSGRVPVAGMLVVVIVSMVGVRRNEGRYIGCGRVTMF